jgi:hypothetical protein
VVFGEREGDAAADAAGGAGDQGDGGGEGGHGGAPLLPGRGDMGRMPMPRFAWRLLRVDKFKKSGGKSNWEAIE